MWKIVAVISIALGLYLLDIDSVNGVSKKKNFFTTFVCLFVLIGFVLTVENIEVELKIANNWCKLVCQQSSVSVFGMFKFACILL